MLFAGRRPVWTDNEEISRLPEGAHRDTRISIPSAEEDVSLLQQDISKAFKQIPCAATRCA